MESFRTLIKGWLGKVLLVLFLTPLALVGIEGYFSGGNNPDVALKVNDDAIAKKEVEQIAQQQRKQYLSMVNGDETLLNDAFIEKTALDYLTNNALFKQQSEHLGLVLSDAQIEHMLAQQPVFHENGQFSQKLFENYLRSNGMNRASLIANIRQSQSVQLLSSSILDTALVTQADLKQLLTLQTQQRDVHTARIDLGPYLAKVKLTEGELKQYFDVHQQQFIQPAQVDAHYVIVSPGDVNVQGTVTEQELQNAYQAFVKQQSANAKREVRHILITADSRSDAEAKKRADEVYAKLKQGTSFASLAAQYSEDEVSKAAGGLIEGYEVGIYGDEFDAAVLKLDANQYSLPVKTQYGYHLIAVDQLQKAAVPSFESQKARLQAELLDTKVKNAYADRINALNELVISSDSLDVVADELKTVRVERVKNVSLTTTHPILSQAAVKTKLFGPDVANGDRLASTAITLPSGETVWFKVDDYRAAGVPAFAAVKSQVQARLSKVKAAELAKADVKAMLAEFNTQPAAQVLAKHPVPAFTAMGMHARSQGLPVKIERAAFSLKAPKAGHWSVTSTTQGNDLVLVAVSAVVNPANEVPEADRAELQQLYQQSRAQQELDDYARYLKSKAKIK